jgi:Zn finger protein HypA/HybF involved in hydrogenase expression
MNNKKRQQKKIKRRLKRKRQKDKKTLDKDMQDVKNKIALFQRRPDECSACNKKFPEKDREAHMTWQVVVHNEEKTVRLFCPDCQEKAKRLVEGENVS